MSFTTRDLADRIDAELIGDETQQISGAAALGRTTDGDLSFFTQAVTPADLDGCRAAALVVTRELAESVQAHTNAIPLLVVDDAQAGFMALLPLFRPQRPRPTIGLSAAAITGTGIEIGENTNVFPGAVIGDDVVIGSGCDIFPGAVIGDGCRLGDDVTVYPNAVLYPELILGHRVIVHAGAVIGADGFGFRFEHDEEFPDGHYVKLPHYGSVHVQDDVEIGAGTTIDRGMIGPTVIGTGTKLDDQVMIAHNCEVGPHNVYASQVAMAGSVTTGGYVRCGGKVGISDHLTIGEGASMAAMSAVVRDVPDGDTHLGYPAGPEAETLRVLLAQKRLPKLLRTVQQLQQRVEELNQQLENLAASSQENSVR